LIIELSRECCADGVPDIVSGESLPELDEEVVADDFAGFSGIHLVGEGCLNGLDVGKEEHKQTAKFMRDEPSNRPFGSSQSPSFGIGLQDANRACGRSKQKR